MNYLIRNLHFIVIHVPIAMLLFSFVFDVLALVLKKKDWHTAALLCLIVGTLGAIAAVLTGPHEERNPLFPTHELFGKVTMVFFILLTLVRLWMQLKIKREMGRNVVYLTAALIGGLLVSYTGHLGGQMVHPDRRFEPGRFQDFNQTQDRNRPGYRTQDQNRPGDRNQSDNQTSPNN